MPTVAPTEGEAQEKKNPAVDLVFERPSPANQANSASSADEPRTSLGAGLLEPWSGRLDRATLHRRVYLHDVLACSCGGRRSIVADIHEPDAIRAILESLGLLHDVPHLARARDPTYDDA